MVGHPVNIKESISRQRSEPASFIPDLMESDEVDNSVMSMDCVKQNVTDLATSATG